MNLRDQMVQKVNNDSKMKRRRKHDGTVEQMISTGSTLLDLAITGGRVRGGGIPGGIFVEIFGPSGAGKTVLLCEIAGGVKRQNGAVMFQDPEARLNKTFAKLFDLDVDLIDYNIPSTVPEVFQPVRKWEPEGNAKINGVFADSLAALSTDLEMGADGDKMGMRRAKEFSEELRKTCRIITQKNLLMVCSNQIRQNLNAGQFGQKYKSPGGEGIPFYASLRLKLSSTTKIKKEIKIAGKGVSRIIGTETQVEIFKSSVWEPYRKAPLTILFDYGIDDIRQNLQFIKDYSRDSFYSLGGFKLSKSKAESIQIIEDEMWEDKLKNEVIDLWEDIEKKFKVERKSKRR
jgi:RecA/RadA recombinase